MSRLAVDLRMMHRASPIDGVAVIDATRRWVEKAVIGLGLCPFASSVYSSGRVRFCVSEQHTAAGLLEELRAELMHLHTVDASLCETTLLIHPRALNDFLEFNEFLALGDATVFDLGLEGEVQVASFHPQYQFAGTAADDISNHTNRSPYPTLHLLREASVEQALAGMANPESIYENNIRRLVELGPTGWQALWVDDGNAE